MLTHEQEPGSQEAPTDNGRHAVLEAGEPTPVDEPLAQEKSSAPLMDAQPGNTSRNVLIVDDDELTRQQLKRLLESDHKLSLDAVGDGRQALHLLMENTYSIVITDLRMPRWDGMDLIREIQQRRLPVTVIVTTGHGSIHDAVAAIRMGAYDFLTKPIDIDNLRLVIQRALRERALQDEVVQLRRELKSRYSFFSILSKNPHMHAVFELIGNVAQTNTTVLIEGETGTGKELVARAIHQASVDRCGPLVPVNCAALPETLLESELFGHEKGSFTSAAGQRRGRFEMAQSGTIFLDEVGDVPASMQAKLLRVLQERRFERVGGTETIEVDVRVIAATNRSLETLVRQKTFREDLFYRLNVVKIDLLPLRDRPEDIPLLAVHFTEKFALPGERPKQLSPRVMEVLLNYYWPGNIRELENTIERACVTSRDNVIEVENLPASVLNPAAPRLPFHIDLKSPLPDVLRKATARIEQQYLSKALRKARGNVSRCAKICGLSRRSVTAKIAEYRLDKSAFKDN
jgi:DNA-binding NtrC family response regulator